MHHLGWKPCRDDRDLWMKVETRPDDGMLYWAYIFIYVDDILCVHHDNGMSITKFGEYVKMKEGSIQGPTLYLGAKLKKTVLPKCVIAWFMSSSKYAQSAVQNIQAYMAVLSESKKLGKKEYFPFIGGYKHELNDNPALDPIMANFFQSHIGILCWCLELGLIFIITEL
jgi:hypothetical protein